MEVSIVPALLVRTQAELTDGLVRLRGVAPWVQVDFVGTNYMQGEENFPHWEEFNFEADLMLPHPADVVEQMVSLGASRVVVHAGEGAEKALGVLQSYRVGDFKVEVGIALKSHDTPQALKAFEGLYDYVQVMGIDHEGRQGEPPDPHHKDIELVRALRAAHPELVLQVDGAVALRVKDLARAGANRLVVGSAIIRADNPRASYKALYNEANGSE